MGKVVKAVVGVAAIVGIGFATGGLGWVAAGSAQAAALGGSGLAAFGSLTAGRLLTSVALSALSSALTTQKAKASSGSGGARADQTLSGASTPANFILGRTLTTGCYVCPPMAHGKSGKTPNAYLTYVISLADAPGHRLDGMLINDRYVEITDQMHPSYGNMIRIGSTGDRAWVRYHNGTQTTADAHLLATYGGSSVRPWTADMVGEGICYAVVTFRYDDQLFSGAPSVKFVMGGIPLYDPRKDSSRGGSGSHRWGVLSTYEPSENPAVQSYNIRRGITLPGGRVWGGAATAAQLPPSSWVAAMNACDAQVDRGDGVMEPAWRSSFEVLASDEPASVLEEIERASSMATAERGGVWSVRVGGPQSPIAFVTDDDVLVSVPVTSEMVRGFDDLYNGAQITYPDPDSGYVAIPAPLYLRDDLVTRDAGRQLVADLNCGAGPYPYQMQRLGQSLVDDSRRGRVYVIALPPEYGFIESLDSISWTSVDDGFANKVFEVRGRTVDPFSQIVSLSLRERDPDDWSPRATVGYTPTPPVWPTIETLGLPDFAVAPWVIKDADGAPRRPGLLLTWDGADLDAVTGIQWQYRVAGGDVVMSGSTTDVAIGSLVQEVSLPNTAYQVRAIPVIAGVETAWSAWLTVISPDTKLSQADMTAELRAALDTLNDWISNGIPGIEGGISNLSALFRRLADDQRAIAAEVIEGSAQRLIAEQKVRQYLATAEYTLGARVDVTDEQVRVVSAAVTALKSVIPNLATADALQALSTVVTQQGTTLSAVSSSVTVLQSQINGKADAGALSSLGAAVTEQAGVVSSQGTAITGLTSGLAATNTNVTAAQNAAQAASDLAGGKGKVMYQSTVPAAADRLAQNLWIDTTGGANTPKRWNGSAWVAVTDKVATDAAQAAADALAVANTKASASAVNTLTTRVTQAELDIEAGADAQSVLSAVVDMFEASGLFRVEVLATPSGALSRIGLKAAATNGESAGARMAALFLEAIAGGGSRVVVQADTFAIADGEGRIFPFYVDASGVYIDVGFIKNLSVGTLKLADGSVTVFNVAGSGVVSSSAGSSTPVLIAELELDTNLASQSVIGSCSFTLQSGTMTSPGLIWAEIAGVNVAELGPTAMSEDNGRARVMSISRPNITANPVTVRLYCRGGVGVMRSNMWAMAAKR